MTSIKLPKLTFWRVVFLALIALGFYSTVVRFTQGLGASTNLSDQFPWGIWIGFDILCGVALAAGGFTISAVVYIFNIKKFTPIIRPTMLTAFLGYLLVVFALMFDLGFPYRVWHPLVMWNPRSVMFEVGWCVTLYTTVLALEFSPIVFERFKLMRLYKIAKAATIPLVIMGVILSTLHQSSLGSLYLIVPHKLHPLWYSPMLPIFFYVSAIALGCAITIFESFLSLRAFRKSIELDLLTKLGKAIIVVLSIYFRLIAATNKNLEAMSSEEKFREDLYYRVNVFSITVPPLRERREDIALLAEHFLKKFAQSMNKPIVAISTEAMSVLTDFDWPGNVRELQNAIERAVLVAKEREIQPSDLPLHVNGQRVEPAGKLLADVERQHIKRVLDESGWNIYRAARLLGIDRVTLYNKIKKYGFKREQPAH